MPEETRKMNQDATMETKARREPKRIRHTVNGDQANGWYCYQCLFFTHDVAAAAEHDGSTTEELSHD